MTDSTAITIEVTIPLPAAIAEFGIAESIQIPVSIIDNWDSNGAINADAVTQRMIRAAQSLNITLLQVLVMRARNDGNPLTYERYVELHEQAREEAEQVSPIELSENDPDPEVAAAVADFKATAAKLESGELVAEEDSE